VLLVPWPCTDKRKSLQGASEEEGTAEDSVGGGAEGDRKVVEPVEDPGSARNETCSQSVLDFLSSTEVGRLLPCVRG